jgi:hypothetical protein
MRCCCIKMENSSSIYEPTSDSISAHVREVLFGDEPLVKIGAYAEGLPDDSPWAWFTIAAQRQDAGDAEGAIAALHRVLEIGGLEVRVYLQAWNCLRSLWQQPPQRLAGEIQGLVVEVALERGLDIVAVYADGSARYINYSGAAIVWDTQDADIDRMVAELLAVGQSFVDVSEPWDGPRPPAPEAGLVRINALTFGGLHLGQGSFKAVSQDGLGGLALRGAFDLMQTLVSKVKARNTGKKE